MQKLTVREAAENLGISEDAVRKRIQRGTLAHRKASDGHVYVYMDNHAGAKQETSVEEISASYQDNRSSWWDYAAGVSGLAVLFGGLIYGLGLFALFVPIARWHTHDLNTAWHATFLVPRAVVAGLGVRQLIAFPLVAGILIFTWLVLSRDRLGSLLSLLPAVLLPWFYAAWLLITLEPPQEPSKIDLTIVLIAVIVVQFGAFWAVSTFGHPLLYHSEKWATLRAFLSLLACVFIAALMLTIPRSPPLPMVDINVKDEDTDAVGTLLTHTDGFWYVLEKQEDKPGSKLTAIPDDEVKRVWVSKAL